MAKYSYEFKMKVVKDYFESSDGYGIIGKKYSLSPSVVRNWVKSYLAFSAEGIVKSRTHMKYSREFKLDTIMEYMGSEISYQELAKKLGIRNPSIIARWKTDYERYGVSALDEKPKGRPPKVPRKNDSEKPVTKPHTPKEKDRIKELEDENIRLKIEIAYLKELRRMKSERSATAMRKPQESYTSSEDPSDSD